MEPSDDAMHYIYKDFIYLFFLIKVIFIMFIWCYSNCVVRLESIYLILNWFHYYHYYYFDLILNLDILSLCTQIQCDRLSLSLSLDHFFSWLFLPFTIAQNHHPTCVMHVVCVVISVNHFTIYTILNIYKYILSRLYSCACPHRETFTGQRTKKRLTLIYIWRS